MAWPTPQEYNEAIQNPAQNFADPDLRAGAPDLSALGLPRPITGNFASVYRVRSARGDWAVRCFWREYGDMGRRYEAIDRHLKAAKLPYTVPFEYLPRGIRVAGKWYPVLKMAWVEGELLGPYLERTHQDRDAMRRLSVLWRRMVEDLEVAGVAHGDLQHGNVLVVRDALQLVDYDGMYVPSLAGSGSHELGHQHYQHPRRGSADFGPELDRFAAASIYLSLLALAREPGLWQDLRAGDEALLLRRADYVQPDTSIALRRITSLGDAEITAIAAALRTGLRGSPASMPSLPRSSPATAPGDRRQSPVSGLLQRLAPSVAGSPAPAPLPSGAPAWLADHLPPPAPTPPPSSLGSLHLVALALVLALLAGGALSVTEGLLVPLVAAPLTIISLVLFPVLLLLVAYHRQEHVRRLKLLLRRQRMAERELRRADRALALRQRDHDAFVAGLRAHLDTLSQERTALERAEAGEIEGIQATRDQAEARCSERDAELSAQQRAEVEALVAGLRDAHIHAQLQTHALMAAELPSIDRAMRLRLWLGGLRSAADVTQERLRSLSGRNPPAAKSLAEWRVSLEISARSSAPTVLPAAQSSRLATRYGRARARIDGDRRRARDTAQRQIAAVRARYQVRYQPLNEELTRVDEEQVRASEEAVAALRVLETRRSEAEVALNDASARLAPFAGTSFPGSIRSALSRVQRNRV